MFACNPVRLSLQSIKGNLLTYLIITNKKMKLASVLQCLRHLLGIGGIKKSECPRMYMCVCESLSVCLSVCLPVSPFFTFRFLERMNIF